MLKYLCMLCLSVATLSSIALSLRLQHKIQCSVSNPIFAFDPLCFAQSNFRALEADIRKICLVGPARASFARYFTRAIAKKADVCTDSSGLFSCKRISKTSTRLQLRSEQGMDAEDAERILTDFDREQQTFAKKEGEGLGGGTSATRWAEQYPQMDVLRNAVMVLTARAERVMIGICAENAAEGIRALKQWVEGLQLPKGRLHGMDLNGIPLNMDEFGAVYIKYNSIGGSVSQAGDAMLNGYGGSFRGIYFNPSLPDGEFRQYAVLPLGLFDTEKSWRQERGTIVAPMHLELDAARLQGHLVPLEATLEALDASIKVHYVDPILAKAILLYRGPDHVTYGVEDWLRGAAALPPQFKIEFRRVDDSIAAADSSDP